MKRHVLELVVVIVIIDVLILVAEDVKRHVLELAKVDVSLHVLIHVKILIVDLNRV